MRLLRCTLFLLLFIPLLQAAPPNLEPADVQAKLGEMMAAHVRHKRLDIPLVKRAMQNYVELLDPAKTYFVRTEVEGWLEPSDGAAAAILEGYQRHDFSAFEALHETMRRAIARRGRIEASFAGRSLPEHLSSKEFQNLDWAESEPELTDRLFKVRALQLDISGKLTHEDQQLALQRLDRRRKRLEGKLFGSNDLEAHQILLGQVLKATASALDSQTNYFTPEEATDFMVAMQQRLFGIGVQLKDSLTGLQVVRIVEGGPAYQQGGLKVGDEIVAVDGEPIIGLDILDSVQKIRGPDGTAVHLTVLRDEEDAEVEIVRGEVVFKETRIETSVEPFGDGVIGRIAMHSFYQDEDAGSASDMEAAIRKMQKEHKLKGLILDLRLNGGGILSQAVGVTGLFISKGIVVSIKDNEGRVHHLRDVTGTTVWDGPLIVLVSRASASASEIVAGTLQDYGRAVIVGDVTTYGKGTFQTTTIDAVGGSSVDPKGEYKVTRGAYYTVSGRSPQLHGIESDVIVPGIFSHAELGEQYSKYPLDGQSISPNFKDDLSDIPFPHRLAATHTYLIGLQQRMTTYNKHIEQLRKNSEARIEGNLDYQAFLEELTSDDLARDPLASRNDHQLREAYNVMRDLIFLTEKTRTSGKV
ncbi:MAG: S41 family peptidase [Parachlamydiales bacterium]